MIEKTMGKCVRCGMEVGKGSIHLFRDWPGRKEAVKRACPNAEVSMCTQPPPAEFWEPLQSSASESPKVKTDG